MTDDEKLLTDRIFDLQKRCMRDFSPQFSHFLDGGEQITIQENCFSPDFNVAFFGGYEEAERKIYGVFPEWEEPSSFPVSVLEIVHTFGGELSHRDYLGSILGLGIERNKTGDILIEGNRAFVFVEEQIAPFIKDNLKKIGSRGVKVKISDIKDVLLPEKKFLEINTVCASLRLDAVVGAATALARAKSVNLVEAGLVKLNHKEVLEASKHVVLGDLISVRGYGRFILHSVGNETRKGRIHIVLKKYI